MEEKIRLGYLYDFYGELLNTHQKEIYERFILDDLSLSEIGEEEGISRQAAHDLIRRCSKKLNEYEDRLHLLEKFLRLREKAKEVGSLATDKGISEESVKRIRLLCDEIVNEF